MEKCTVFLSRLSKLQSKILNNLDQIKHFFYYSNYNIRFPKIPQGFQVPLRNPKKQQTEEVEMSLNKTFQEVRPAKKQVRLQESLPQPNAFGLPQNAATLPSLLPPPSQKQIHMIKKAIRPVVAQQITHGKKSKAESSVKIASTSDKNGSSSVGNKDPTQASTSLPKKSSHRSRGSNKTKGKAVSVPSEKKSVENIKKEGNKSSKQSKSKIGSKAKRSVKSITKRNAALDELNSNAPMRSTKSEKLSAAEAAAKLSYPWHSIGELQRLKLDAETNQGLVKLDDNFLIEMKHFLESNQGLLTNGGDWSKLGLKEDMTESFNNVMESIALSYMQQALSAESRVNEYKPVTIPKFQEVQTNWPGFEHKPVDNWKDYIVPPPALAKVQEVDAHEEKVKGQEQKSKSKKNRVNWGFVDVKRFNSEKEKDWGKSGKGSSKRPTAK